MLIGNDDHENRPRKFTLGEDDKEKLLAQHEERTQLRQIEADLNLIKVLRLGEAFKRLKDG
ncbi:hypothetical protein [Sphingosinicella sp. YJ22]|uniref:hypothetical protein n=1 Tax=Sphingosinicella sp. YJ22 TaxID=1104780 RepID=UPI00140E5A43|nr:hypothetical protein [Sphingosinicella sp. YJ22]